jgi:hypothetical protein
MNRTGHLPLSEHVPQVLPDGWTILQPWGDGFAYKYRNGIRVIVSTGDWPEGSGQDWMHISVSRKDRLPSWDDMKFVKNTFAEKYFGYQVFAPPSAHVNIHDFCLHIWVPLTGEPPIPNFGSGGTI